MEPSSASGKPGLYAIFQTWAVRICEKARVSPVERVRRRPRDRGTRVLRADDDFVHLCLRADVVGERDATETVHTVVDHTRVLCKLLSAPKHESKTTGLQEDRLLDLLTLPSEALVERPSACQVRDADRDEAHPLIHGSNVLGAPCRVEQTRGHRLPMRPSQFEGPRQPSCSG